MQDQQDLSPDEGALVQLIEFHARDIDQFQQLTEQWRDRIGREGTARGAVRTADGDRPDTYVQVVAQEDAEATEGEAGFRNLDVRQVMRM